MKHIFFFVVCMLFAHTAQAVETVKNPNVEKDLFEIEQKGKYQMDVAGSRNHNKEFELNIGYGITDNWKSKIEFTADNDRAGDMVYRSMKVENMLQFMKSKNGAFADMSVYQDVRFADRSDNSHDFTIGVAARKTFAATTNTINLNVKHDFGDTAKGGTNFIYRWQTRFDISPEFQPGFEILGDTRKSDVFQKQTLGMGPVLIGNVGFDRFGGDKKQKIGYELGYIVGVTAPTPDGTLKWKLKYAQQF